MTFSISTFAVQYKTHLNADVEPTSTQGFMHQQIEVVPS